MQKKKSHPDASVAKPQPFAAGLPTWINRELVEKTIQVWQRYYPKPLTPDDAVSMLLNVGRLFNLLSRGSVS